MIPCQYFIYIPYVHQTPYLGSSPQYIYLPPPLIFHIYIPSTHQVPKMVSRHFNLLFSYYEPPNHICWIRWKNYDISIVQKNCHQKILIFSVVSGHIKIMNSAIFFNFQKIVKRFRKTPIKVGLRCNTKKLRH